MKHLKRFISGVICSSMIFAGIAASAVDITTGTEDEIILSKAVAETTDGTIKDEHGNIAQTFDINLSVKGKTVYPGAKCDIVLAVDLSNSMTNNRSENLAITKEAATEFINTVLPDEHTNARVAIVAYGTYARAYNFSTNSWDLLGQMADGDVYYTANQKKASKVINSSSFKPAVLEPTERRRLEYNEYESGGTNTEAGFKAVQAVTDTRNNNGASSFVVFMTDGIPTYRLGTPKTETKRVWNSETWRFDTVTYTSYPSMLGNGSTTSPDDFNKAAEAAKKLKNSGNDIYTVGLLTDYANDSYSSGVADALLSAKASYKASGSAGALKFTEDGDAYAVKNYAIKDKSVARDVINDIYKTLTYRCFALATGTVTDVIPADFKISEESKETLRNAGCTVIENEDGTTTVTFFDVTAADEAVMLPKFTIVSRGGGYGTQYTNANAVYTGELYDGTPVNKVFQLPVAGINPWTVDDSVSANVGAEITIDVAGNDLFAEKEVAGYDATDYEIIITDEEGNPCTYSDFTAISTGRAVKFRAADSDTRVFYYVVKAEAQSGDNFVVNGTTQLVSRPTKVIVTLSGKPSIDLKGLGYAYIFGYEPIITENGVDIYMAMDDAVTREQVSAMIMRMIDQKYDTKDVLYSVSERVAPHAGTWYERGLAYEDSKGAFEDVVKIGPVTRGEVAKLIACGLDLSMSQPNEYEDTQGHKYEEYINKVTAYGYMTGNGNGMFAPDDVMTRAEFCALFNNIIGRNEMGLIAEDGTVVTAETYHFVDMDPSHWAYETCLKATSAYNENGYVDLSARLENIRNILDQYDAQKEY